MPTARGGSFSFPILGFLCDFIIALVDTTHSGYKIVPRYSKKHTMRNFNQPFDVAEILPFVHAETRQSRNTVKSEFGVLKMFKNRRQAGYLLSKKVRALDFRAKSDRLQAVVYGLSESAMPIAAEIALALNCPLKPLFSGDLPRLGDSCGDPKTVSIIVDDGINSAKALGLVDFLKQYSARIVVAAPVITLDAFRKLETCLDSCVSLVTPERTNGICDYYMNFELVTDKDVSSILNECNGSFLRSA